MTRRRSLPGFTLVEMLCALTITALVGSVSTSLIYSGVKSYRNASARAMLHSEISTALDDSFRLLTSIPRDTTAAVVAPAISSVTATSITWNTNSSITLSGSQLMYSEAGATAACLLNNVTSFTIATYDESNAALAATLSGASTRAIRRVEFQATVSRDGVTETLRMRAFIRSTMSGAAIG